LSSGATSSAGRAKKDGGRLLLENYFAKKLTNREESGKDGVTTRTKSSVEAPKRKV